MTEKKPDPGGEKFVKNKVTRRIANWLTTMTYKPTINKSLKKVYGR